MKKLLSLLLLIAAFSVCADIAVYKGNSTYSGDCIFTFSTELRLSPALI
jgi:hypothetical protein